ncbi:MAG TPA: hypothetical protein VJ372_03030 [Pyrinomonadaceae bacterium]|jgi:hypothetical protein|nr:hypothetical protein [Pyrinomonadaceae bacterium]
MNRKHLLRRMGGFVLAALLACGVAIMSSTAVNAQRGGGFHGGGFHGGGFHGGGHTRVFIGPRFGYGYPYWYYGYPYGYLYGYYSHYVFGDSEAADAQGYHDGLKTGSNDARRGKSNDPERSHYFKDSGFGNFAGDYREGFTRGYNAAFHG